MTAGHLSGAEMWARYVFRGHEVVVIQQTGRIRFGAFYGRRMVRIASAVPGEEDAATGMAEDAFLSEAQPAAPPPASGS